MVKVIPRWHLTIEFMSNEPIEFIINASTLSEVTEWVNKLNFFPRIIKRVKYEIMD